MFNRKTIGAVSAGMLLLAAFTATGAEIQPHRVRFALALAEFSLGGVVANVTGTMEAEVLQNCSGISVEQVLELRITGRGGQVTESTVTSFNEENHAGTEMSFHAEISRDGITEAFVGFARLDERGGAGIATYEVPFGMHLDLPVGTFFPISHALAVMEAATEKRRFHSALLFEGGAPDTLAMVSVRIGDFQKPLTQEFAPFSGLVGRAAWRTDFDYYSYAFPSLEPDYRVGYIFYEGGILDQLDLDYGEFRLSGTMQSLELMPQPRC